MFEFNAQAIVFFVFTLFILGGGASKNFESFRPHLNIKAEIVQAQLLNEAGIVGAALAAAIHREGQPG